MISSGKWEVTGAGWVRRNLKQTEKAFCPSIGVKKDDSFTPIAEVAGLGKTEAETQDNANLIAAAPELLAACKGLANITSIDCDDYPDMGAYRQTRTMLDKLIEAIAAAEGKL